MVSFNPFPGIPSSEATASLIPEFMIILSMGITNICIYDTRVYKYMTIYVYK